MSDRQYYFVSQGKTYGPFSKNQLKQSAGSGVILPEDIVWTEDWNRWVPARKVARLLPRRSKAVVSVSPEVEEPLDDPVLDSQAVAAWSSRWLLATSCAVIVLMVIVLGLKAFSPPTATTTTAATLTKIKPKPVGPRRPSAKPPINRMVVVRATSKPALSATETQERHDLSKVSSNEVNDHVRPDAVLKKASQSEPFEEWLPEDKFFPRRRYVGKKVDGQVDGEAECFAENGRRCVVEHLERGVLQGVRTSFYPSGKKFSEFTFRDGKAEGTQTVWFEDGTVASRMENREGVADGPTSSYFKNGKLFIEGSMRDGRAEGTRRHYLYSGDLLGITKWENGVQVDQSLVREASYSDLQFIKERVAFSPWLKDHWKQVTPNPAPGQTPALGRDKAKQKAPAKRR